MDHRIHEDFKPLSHITLPMGAVSLAAARRSLHLHGASVRPLKGSSMVTRRIVSDDGKLIPVRVFSPSVKEKLLPCLVYFHGGAFVIPAAPYHWKLANLYALKTPCKVVFVDYRLAPQHPFPTGLMDCYSALRWVDHNASLLGVDRNRIAIGGDSAGGNLTAAVALMARDRGEISPCFQMMIYPVTDARMITPSMEEFSHTPVWNGTLNHKMWEWYLPHPPEHRGYASPMEADSLEGLPPAYVETAEIDCLRDEGIAYAKALEAAGTPVTLHQTKGTPHGFDIMLHSPIVKVCVEERIKALRQAFGREHNGTEER